MTHRRSAQSGKRREALPHERRNAVCRFDDRWPPRNLAAAQQALSLRQQYYERTWDAPTPSAMSAALNVLEAQAQFDGPERHREANGLVNCRARPI